MKQSVIISNKPGIYKLHCQLSNDLRLMKVLKLHKIIA